MPTRRVLSSGPNALKCLDTTRPDFHSNSYLYFLIDPETKYVRYVGITWCVPARLQLHYSDRHAPEKHEWLHSLWLRGLQPIVNVTDMGRDEELRPREKAWIHRLLAAGHPLLNRQCVPGRVKRPTQQQV